MLPFVPILRALCVIAIKEFAEKPTFIVESIEVSKVEWVNYNLLLASHGVHQAHARQLTPSFVINGQRVTFLELTVHLRYRIMETLLTLSLRT